jgi:type I restriction enzyme R subunit
MNEADTCRRLIVPKLQAAGWDNDPHSIAEQRWFTKAREILDDLLERYAADGELQFTLPEVLKVPPISWHGNVNEIIGKFGRADQLRSAVNQLQSLLYAA